MTCTAYLQAQQDKYAVLLHDLESLRCTTALDIRLAVTTLLGILHAEGVGGRGGWGMYACPSVCVFSIHPKP